MSEETSKRRFLYEYAVLRVVPRPERGEGLNAGVALYCPERKFLRAAVRLDEGLLRAMTTELSPDAVLKHLQSAEKVCAGGAEAGALGTLPPRERFGRVVAPRSGVIQPSEVRTGLTRDPEKTLKRLLREVAGGRASG